MSDADVLAGRLPADNLKDKIILIGKTTPGLLDLHVTPVGQVYPDVEAHANLTYGWLDDKVTLKADYSFGYDVFVLIVAGLLLAIGLPLLSPPRAVLLSVGVLATVAELTLGRIWDMAWLSMWQLPSLQL